MTEVYLVVVERGAERQGEREGDSVRCEGATRAVCDVGEKMPALSPPPRLVFKPKLNQNLAANDPEMM
jgi:hypothetical protein